VYDTLEIASSHPYIHPLLGLVSCLRGGGISTSHPTLQFLSYGRKLTAQLLNVAFVGTLLYVVCIVQGCGIYLLLETLPTDLNVKPYVFIQSYLMSQNILISACKYHKLIVNRLLHQYQCNESVLAQLPCALHSDLPHLLCTH
jgi:hypothetical protein